jgi:hypothetical protein
MAGLGEWQAAVRAHPDRPPPMQCFALDRLSLRLNWKTGEGFASTAAIAADAECSESTVKRAIAWARTHHLLHRTRRGHRLGDGSAAASEWRTCVVSQRVTGDLLTGTSTGHRRPVEQASIGHQGTLNRSIGPSQQVTRESNCQYLWIKVLLGCFGYLLLGCGL